MHELAITEAIVSIVVRKALEANASKVTRIDLEVGRLTGIVPECVELQFALLGEGTIAQGARLCFDLRPVNLKCRACDITYARDEMEFSCPRCRGLEIDVLSGFELSVQSIEAE